MRVLLLNRFSLADTSGGVAEFLNYLPPALSCFSVETVIYSQGKTPGLSGPQILENGMRAYSGPFLKPGFFASRKKLQPLIDLCRTEKIDLVHAQGAYRNGYVALQLFKLTKIPYVITSHADIVATNSSRIKRRNVRKRCCAILQNAKGVTHLSPVMEEVSHALCDTRNKSVIIGNGVDVASWNSFSELPERDYFLGIGRLEPEKGFDILIDAFAKLHQQGIETSLIIAGTGSAASELFKQVKVLGLNLVTELEDFSMIPKSSVIFPGYVKNDLKKKLIAQAKMILFPTQPSRVEEAFGIVQIEAMAAGKALIASDAKATRYLESLGLQVVCVKADDSSSWADQILLLLKDDALRKQLGQMNLQNAKRFDWHIIAKQYVTAYEHFLERLAEE